ncbi:MAG: hypothetical protein ACYTGN_09550 [Planctomycetota bacterium]|jgi:hypothetical protein
MRTGPILLVLCAALFAQDEGRPDPLKTTNALMKANADKDVLAIQGLLKDISEIGNTSKDAGEVEPIAEQLVVSLKIAKAKKGEGLLKKLAFKKKFKDEDEEKRQVAAVEAVAKMRNPKLIGKFGDLSKTRSVEIAKAAYASFKNYGTSKGKVRKSCAEILMKRLEAEKPSAGQSGTISAEAQERWKKLESTIVSSMQAVCHQDTINDVENWREWWKENKRNAKAWKDPKKE